jgi:hypothetical protein
VLETLRDFQLVYRDYARAVAKGRALDLTRADSAHQKARATARERAEERDAVLARRVELEVRLEQLIARERELEERIRALEASTEFRAARDLDAAAEDARQAEEFAGEQERRADEDAAHVRRAKDESEAARRDAADRGAQVGITQRNANAAAAAAELASSHALEAIASSGEVAAAKVALEGVLRERRDVLSALEKLRQALGRAEAAHARAEERARDRGAEAEAARTALAAAEAALAEAEEFKDTTRLHRFR